MNAYNSKSEIISTFLWLRRTIRLAVEFQDAVYSTARSLERSATILEQENPLRAAYAASLRKKARDLRDQYRRERPFHLRNLGNRLMHVCKAIDEVTTLAERCDLLGVNSVDRLRLDASERTSTIITMGLEESAIYRDRHHMDAPLAQAQSAYMMHWMTDTPEGREAADAALEEVFGYAFPLPGERPIDSEATCHKPTLH